jgi:uncharacterized protein (DUF1330 family)
MPAYFIVQNTIQDEAQYQKYVQAVVPFIASFGGRLAARRAKVEVLEGEHDQRPVVMFEFPDMEFAGLRSDQEAARRYSHHEHLGISGRLIGQVRGGRTTGQCGQRATASGLETPLAKTFARRRNEVACYSRARRKAAFNFSLSLSQRVSSV